MRIWAVVGLAAALVAAALLWPRPAAPPAAPPPDRPALPLPAAIADAPVDAPVVMWVAQAKARFEPCGCVAGMHGGLMRRASLTARLPRSRAISLELGGWSGGSLPHEQLRSRHYLRGLAGAGIGAVAVGEAEAGLGRERFAELAAEAAALRLPLLSANLDLPGVAALTRLTAGGRRFAVTAVVSAAVPGARDPVEALAAAAAAAGGEPLICLADLDADGCRALARAVPQLALVLGGRADHPSPEPVAIGPVRVLWAGNHGKVLGSWAWGQPAAAFELLADTLPEDPPSRALLAAYQRDLAAGSYDGPGTAGGLRALGGGGGWTGSAACMACHQDAHRVHAGSLHRQAFAALERKGYQHDPDCLRCHVTGLGEGGYVRGAAALAEVGCEACHGPGERHVRDLAPMPRLSPASCVACHDAENSPRFDHAVYWPRVLHGLDPAGPRRPAR